MSRTAVATILPVLLFVCMLAPLRAGFTDDGYIHVQYANNIITRGEYSFNAGEVSFGTTSPLWVIVHAALGRPFGGGEGLVWISRALSWLAGIAAVCLMVPFARALGLRPWIAFLCAVAFASHAWLARWTALSMETSSAVAAIIAVGIASVHARRDAEDPSRATPHGSWLLGFFMAVASLLRPEAYLLLPVYVLAVALSRGPRDWKGVARTIAVYAALVLPWLAFAKLHIGRFLPNTAGAKSGGLVVDPVVFVQKLTPILKIVGSAEGLSVILVASAVLFGGRRTRLFSGRYRFLLLWVVALPVAYVVFDIQVLSRYMLLTSPFTIVLGFAALEEWLEKLGVSARPARWIPASVALATVMVNVVFYFTIVVPPSRAFTRNLTHDLKALALHINRTSPADAVVAAADIGYLAFYSGRHVLDLGGLVDNATHALREEYTYEEIVERGLYLQLPKYPRVDFFIDREKVADRFDGRTMHGRRFESVRVQRIDNLGIRKPGPFFYTLYRLHPRHDG